MSSKRGSGENTQRALLLRRLFLENAQLPLFVLQLIHYLLRGKWSKYGRFYLFLCASGSPLALGYASRTSFMVHISRRVKVVSHSLVIAFIASGRVSHTENKCQRIPNLWLPNQPTIYVNYPSKEPFTK